MSRIVKANDLVRKLAFVAEIVSQWIANEGLGRLDFEWVAGGEKLYWEGMMVKDQARKTDRITVGRLGGDDGTLASAGSSLRTTTSARTAAA